jgi:hypothetical protein
VFFGDEVHNQSLQQTKPPVTSPACAGAAPAVFAAEAGVRRIGALLGRGSWPDRIA